MISELIDEAVGSGARLDRACDTLGLTVRTVQRWRKQGRQGFDRRFGPKTPPGNKLSPSEQQAVLDAVNRPEHRDLSPKQIVPRLADEGVYLASESTVYRILHQEDALHPRETSRPRSVARPREHVTTGPLECWSWDITYLRSAVRGAFYYLYLIEDIWSRKIVGWAVHEEESMDLSACLIDDVATRLGCDRTGLVLHSDNGGPMKGSTMLATLKRLGIVESFSRPHVSDDNPYSESLFRTLKYRPAYPRGAFESLAAARKWGRGLRRLVQHGAPPQCNRFRDTRGSPYWERRSHPCQAASGLRGSTETEP
jgi:putative transposase